MNLAIMHEWFESYAGSERVVEQLLHTFPSAEVHALVDFLKGADRDALQGKDVETSFIQRLPFARKQFRNYLPLMPMAVEQFDLSGYDTVISSNHAFAKGIITRPDQMHVSYVHTPIRYAWELQHDYLRQANLTRGLKGMFVRATLHYLRNWDRMTSDRVDAYVANSHYIAARIRKTYRRPAYVIHPPVDINQFAVEPSNDDFYLTASRMVPYKRIDLIVEAFAKMPDRRLVVIGDGPEMKKIAAKATPNVQLLGYQPFDVLFQMWKLVDRLWQRFQKCQSSENGAAASRRPFPLDPRPGTRKRVSLARRRDTATELSGQERLARVRKVG